MNYQEKTATIEALKEKFEKTPYFYITDSSELTVETVTKLRALCYEHGVEMKVVKNTLIKKALESFDEEQNYGPLLETLKGPTTLMFSDVANAPARLIKEFRAR